MKKNKKKKSQIIYIILLFLIICLVVFYLKNDKPFYKVEDRTSQVTKEKKKDTDKIITIGWIKVQGTNIDAPIVSFTKQYDERYDEVARKNFAYNYERDETLFNKVNILGHNILNLSSHPRIEDNKFSRFDNLMAFVYTDFAKKNKYIQYTIDGENYLYKIYSVRLYKTYEKVETIIDKTYTKDEIIKYVKKIKKDSIYDYDVEVTKEDNLISLITCTRFFGGNNDSAFVVDARMVRKGEKIKNYPVEETDNYKKILKILKGDGNNEV